jgi:hypothetical protein
MRGVARIERGAGRAGDLDPLAGAKFLITPSKFCSAVADIVLRSSS